MSKVTDNIYSGELQIGSYIFQCFVINSSSRVIQASSLALVMSRELGVKDYKKQIQKLVKHPLLRDKYGEMPSALENPIEFVLDEKPVKGYDGTIIIDICNLFVSGRRLGILDEVDYKVLRFAEAMLVAIAKTGINALIDEVTGFQRERSSDALRILLEKYLTDEFAKWSKTFPDDFYIEMFRLRKMQFPPMEGNRKPAYIGHLTNDIIYSRLAPGVLSELRRLNPVNERGNRARRHHQYLTRDIGHTALTAHLSGVIYLMKANRTWRQFYAKLNHVSPKLGDSFELLFNEPEA